MNEKNPDKSPTTRFNPFNLLLLFLAIVVIHDLLVVRNAPDAIPYSQFLSELNDKKIDSVMVTPDRVEGTYKSGQASKNGHFTALRMEDPNLAQALGHSGVRFEALHESNLLKDLFAWFGPLLLIFGLGWLIAGQGARAPGQFLSLRRSKAKIYVERDLKVRFADVAGVDEAKGELQELVDFLKDPTKYGRLGGRMPKGLLLVGPPGTGKTLLARAVAGEARVPFFSINGSEFVEMFVGLGAARVRDLFEQARVQSPCIIFIDELDALGKMRGAGLPGTGANDEKEQTLNQLLAELDGFDPSSGVVILAATNRPEVLDPALLRSGRFDRQIVIDKPDRKGRAAILSIHLKTIQVSDALVPDSVASLTAGFSGADLANLVNEAALTATRRGADKVEESDFVAGIERIVGGLERKSRVLSTDEKLRVAHHEMGHTAVSMALERNATVNKVSIIPRGIGALGYTIFRPTEDRYLMDREELERKLAVSLGGRAAESLFFSSVSTGAADDLDRATDMARSMVTRYGMGVKLGLLTYDRETSPFLDSRILARSHDYSEQTAQWIDQETREIVNQAFHQASLVVRRYRAFIEDGVHALLERETLEEKQLRALWVKHQATEAPKPSITLTR